MVPRAFACAFPLSGTLLPPSTAVENLSAFRSHPECHFLNSPPALIPPRLLQPSTSVSSERLTPSVNKYTCCQCIYFISLSLSVLRVSWRQNLCVYPVLQCLTHSQWSLNEKGCFPCVSVSFAAKQTTPKHRSLKQQPCLLLMTLWEVLVSWALLQIPTDPRNLGNSS